MRELKTEKKKEVINTTKAKFASEKQVVHDFPRDHLRQGLQSPERFTPLVMRLSHPANEASRTRVLTDMQQIYGNKYVQHVISASREQNTEQDEIRPGYESLSLDEDTGSTAGGSPGTTTSTTPPAGTGAATAKGTPPTLPRVSLGNFRHSGSLSSNNKCRIRVSSLGVSSSSGLNFMEIRGDISGHVSSAQYDIKRTKERATWKKVGTTWTQLTHVGPGADDDTHDQDEDLTPDSNQIYSIDGPGFRTLSNPVGDASATEAVYKANFIETANVRVGTGAWRKNSNDLSWHSISWLEKVRGTWRRKTGVSEIKTGTTTVGRGNP